MTLAKLRVKLKAPLALLWIVLALATLLSAVPAISMK